MSVRVLVPSEGPPIATERDATDLIGQALGAGAGLVAIPVERLADGFLTLSTRMAGGVIQKFVNYGLQVAFVGDISAAVATSQAIHDFVYESNRGRHVWFVADLGELDAKIAAHA